MKQKILIICLFIISQNLSALESSFSEQKKYYKCHGIFVRERPSLEDPLLKLVEQKKLSAIDACMMLLSKAELNKKNVLDDFKKGKKILRNFQAFHNTWFPSYLTYMTNDSPQVFDLVELESPGLFVTKSLFSKKTFPLKNIFSGDVTYEGIRKLKDNQKVKFFIGSKPKDKIEVESFLVGDGDYIEWHPKMLERGELVGIKEAKLNESILPKYIDHIFYPTVHNSKIDIKASLGGGILGSSPYLLFNLGRSIGEKSDGRDVLPRRYSQQIINDFLCRDLPVISLNDAKKLIFPTSDLSYAKTEGCMRCHGTLDNLAIGVRNTEMVISNESGVGSSHIKFHKPVKKIDLDMLYTKTKDFHLSYPLGKFVYRTMSNKYLAEKFENLDELGAVLSKLDDFYSCTTIKYVNFLTGSDHKMSTLYKDFSNEESKQIIKLSRNLKETQSLKLLIKNILKTFF